MSYLTRLESQKAPQLEVLRIALGLALMATFAPLTLDLSAFYGDNGWISREAFAAVSLDTGWPSVFAWVRQPATLVIVHMAFLLGILAFILGWAVRWIKWPLWVLYISYLNRNPAVVYGVDLLTANLLFLVCVAPVGRWLIARPVWDRPPTGPRAAVCLALVRWQMAVVFFFSAIQKLRGELWWSGDAIWVVLNNAEFAQLPAADFIAHNLWLGALATHGCLLIELAYPFLIWGRRTRPWLLGAAITLHLATALLFGLYLFAWVAIAGHLAFLQRLPARRLTGAPSPVRREGAYAHARDGVASFRVEDRTGRWTASSPRVTR